MKIMLESLAMTQASSSIGTSLVSEAFPFPDAPDIESSSIEYEKRFSGPIGEWFISVQAKALLQIIGKRKNISILDVGGGHAQTAIPLINNGHHVNVLGSNEQCSRKLESYIQSGKCLFKVGKLLELPFADKSFDVVLSFRQVSHMTDWPRFLSELSRVSKELVIIDYPPRLSFNALTPLLFKTKKILEGDTRNYLVFNDNEILQQFKNSGFTLYKRIPQFFLPMVIHRALKKPSVSNAFEKASEISLLKRFLGSPVVAGFISLA